MIGFLAAGGATASSALGQALKVGPAQMTAQPGLGAALGIITKPDGPLRANPSGALSEFAILRPDDLLHLDVRLVNAAVTGAPASRQIVRSVAGKQALMVVNFPPQAIAEQVYPDTLNATGTPNIDTQGGLNPAKVPPPVTNGPIARTDTSEALIAGPTRLAFIMPSGTNAIAFTVEAILDACGTWALNLDARAGDPPADMEEAHDFDRTRVRMTLLVNAQKAKLQAYGQGVEALLTRAGERVAEAIAELAGKGEALGDDTIDALISDEIATTLDPNTPPAAITLTGYGRTAHNYVSSVATQALVNLAQSSRVDVINPVTGTPQFEANNAARNNQIVATLEAPQTSLTVIKNAQKYMVDLRPRPISPDATDIEVPYRLHLSPLSTAGFAHASTQVDHGSGFFDLWHTRMGTRVSDWVLSENPEPVRALWADDIQIVDGKYSVASMGTNWSLLSADRADLVNLMSNTGTKEGRVYTPLPAMAKHLRLTALGASLEAEGSWPDHLILNSNLVQWKHITSIGRDQYVRVVYDGYLFPFGHAASLIKVSERKFFRQQGGARVAGLLQKFFIVVRERVRSYPGDAQRYGGRDMPLSSIEILTHQTPDLMAPAEEGDVAYANAEHAYEVFWPQLMSPTPNVSGGDMRFHMAAIDSTGRRHTFDMPLMFVAGTRNQDSDLAGGKDTDALIRAHSPLEEVALSYNKLSNTLRRKAIFSRALMRWSVDVDGNGAPLPEGESDYHANSITFEGWKALSNIDGARFYPRVLQAELEIPAVKNLLGQSCIPAASYHQYYLDHGFGGGNPAQMVFGFAKQAVQGISAKPTNVFGGLLAPSLAPDGLSRKLGALTGADAFKDGSFNSDPDSGSGLLAGIPDDMTLLGVISVKTILKAVIDLTGDVSGVPVLKTITAGDRVETSYSLTRKTVDAFEDLFLPQDPGGDDQFNLTTTAIVAKMGQPPQLSTSAALKAFKINLFGFIILHFDELSMVVKPGQKPDVTPALNSDDGVVFGGPLEFVNDLRNLIPMDGFSDPPGLEITPTGLSASYSLSLPDVGIGVMSLSNISLGAGFNLPFTGGGPTASFNFAERQNPFNLTVSLFGGGGFFAITIGSAGVQELEAALEFGAQISIDLGVASGGVYIKGGFYFHWIGVPVSQQLVQFEGYVELGGHLSVLGLITVSLTFHLGLTYQKSGGQSSLYGTATLTVEIDILFFSISQDVTVQKQFAGSDADPSFLLFMPGDVATNESPAWAQYCDAFA